MSTEINEAVQAIGEGCAGRPGGVPELLAAAAPEFLGGLAVALVTALATWGLHRRRIRRAPDDAC
ncbi:hypothetical protein ABTX81_27090 [Kitasatospora sp. NPDC097605]|uniref:hypothetical protein n=1 Tax=Kitasatospora sp. NPDC097605 TaxID=3157226 RepID=UPI00332457A5